MTARVIAAGVTAILGVTAIVTADVVIAAVVTADVGVYLILASCLVLDFCSGR